MQGIKDSQLIKLASYIDGNWFQSDNRFAVINPANQQVVAEVADAGIEETQAAVVAAKKALPAWSKKSVNERAALMRKWFNLMMEHQDDLGRLLTLEQGKPLAELKMAMTKFPQVMINVPAVSAKVMDNDAVQAAVREVEAGLGDKGRVLLRPSGTEPLIRVMVEGDDAQQVTRLAEQLAAVVAASED